MGILNTAPNPLIEVHQDLSGYIEHGSAEFPIGGGGATIYTKRRRFFLMQYSQFIFPNPLVVYRHNGGGLMEPTVEDDGFAISQFPVHVSDGVLRGAFATYPELVFSCYTSDDGELWEKIADGFQGIQLYAVLGDRLVAYSVDDTPQQYSVRYSDDDGATWQASDFPSVSNMRQIAESGGRLIFAGEDRRVYTSANGAVWSSTATDGFRALGPRPIALNDSGVVIINGRRTSDSARSILRSDDHGASWTILPHSGNGIGAHHLHRGTFWDGAQFVAFRGASGEPDTVVFTSPTGASWTSVMAIPGIGSFVRVIN